jgi:hypothetical protein
VPGPATDEASRRHGRHSTEVGLAVNLRGGGHLPAQAVAAGGDLPRISAANLLR